MSIQINNKMSTKTMLFWAIAVAFPALILIMPTNEVFTSDIRAFCAITACAILLFAFEIVHFFIPVIILPIAYILAGIAPNEVAFAPWTGTMPWMMLSAFLIVNIVDRIGLLERGAYAIIMRTGGTYRGTLYGLMLAGIVCNLFLPGIVYLVLIPLSYSICKSLGITKSKAAAGIMFGGLLAANLPSLLVFTPGFLGLAQAVAKPFFVLEIGWIQCLLHNIIFLPMCFLMVVTLEKVFPCDVVFEGKAMFQEKLTSMGKMKKDEKKALFLLVCFLLCLITSGIHKIEIGWIFVIICCVFYLPGFRIGTAEDILKINYAIVFFIVACMSIGQVSGSIGMGEIIASMVLPVLSNVSSYVFIGLIWALAVLLNLLLTPLAAIATFTVPMTQIAMDLGINPLPVIYTFIQGLDQVFLPYEYANFLFMFSFGVVSIQQFIKFCSIKMAINFIYIMAIAVPYWFLIGLL